ncbi:MAG: hypothetical protein WDO14_00055 [Bacteroidota bacterium]
MHAVRAGGLRSTLSISQFCISLLFITTSVLIFNQFKHYMAFDYGMKTENIINISLNGIDREKATIELSQVPGVVSISASDLIPATDEPTAMSIVARARQTIRARTLSPRRREFYR